MIRRRGDALRAHASLLADDVAEAEDLLQEALATTFVRARELDLRHAEGYLRRVMAATCVDRFRRRQQWDRVRHLLGRQESDEGPAEQVLERRDVQQALDRLSPQQRSCVVLRFWDGHGADEGTGAAGAPARGASG